MKIFGQRIPGKTHRELLPYPDGSGFVAVRRPGATKRRCEVCRAEMMFAGRETYCPKGRRGEHPVPDVTA